MGYTTNFSGYFKFDKPLSVEHLRALEDFAHDNHNLQELLNGQEDDSSDGHDYCQWVPDEEGETLVWDGGEKFYDYVEWLEYLIVHFLKPWGYTLNGEVEWKGEQAGDLGKIIVTDNLVDAKKAKITY